jgi:hypothetical protein
MTPFPDALDLAVSRSLIAKIRGGTLFTAPQETANEAWDLLGYGLSYLPVGTPPFGATALPAVITDNEAADLLEGLADAKPGFTGPITGVIIAKLAAWAISLLLGRIIGH